MMLKKRNKENGGAKQRKGKRTNKRTKTCISSRDVNLRGSESSGKMN